MSRTGGVEFVVRPAGTAVRGAIREFWLLRDDGDYCTGLPKPHVEVILSLRGVHWWRATPAGREHRYDFGWVTPVQDGPRYARAIGGRTLIGARLEPWAAQAWLGRLPPGDGTPPPWIDLFALPGVEALRRALIACTDDGQRLALYEDWFSGFPVLRQPDRPGFRAPADGRAQSMAAKARLSDRTLRRWFSRSTGVSPKRWLRLHRFDRVVRSAALRDPGATLASIAADHGYADQAHFSREIGAFIGAAPGRLRDRPDGAPPHYIPGR